MSHRRRASRPTRVAVGGLLAALALAGCSATNPIQTHRDYSASDGVVIDVGELRVGNTIVLTESRDAAGTLVGYVTNNGDEATEVQVAVGGADAPTRFRVPAGATVHLGPDGDETVDISSVPADPGSKIEVQVSSTRDGQALEVVPVLDGTLEEYADLVP